MWRRVLSRSGAELGGPDRDATLVHRQEADVHDMIGCAGMLRGWAVLWHMAFVWLLPALVVCVAMSAAAELLIAAYSVRRPLRHLPPVRVLTPLATASQAIPVMRRAPIVLADSYPIVAFERTTRSRAPWGGG